MLQIHIFTYIQRLEAGIKSELQKPELLKCTLLRKYMATATQMLSVCDNELGHSVKVHEEYYKIMPSTIERAKIAKLLLLADQGRLGEFKGKSLDEIQDNEINMDVSVQLGGGASTSSSLVDIPDKEMDADDDGAGDEDEQGDDDEVPCKKPKYKQPWSAAETKEVEDYFEEFVLKLKAPSKGPCLAFLEFSKYKTNKVRTWEDIKNKINGVVQREKRKQKK